MERIHSSGGESEGEVTIHLYFGDTRPFWVDMWYYVQEEPGESQWEPCWEDSGVREVGSGDSQADSIVVEESPGGWPAESGRVRRRRIVTH